MALTIIPFLFKIYMLQTQSRVLLGSMKQQKSSYQNYFTSRFSLSEKLHLETGLAFNTTLFFAGSFAAGNNSDLAYTFGKYGHRRGTLL
jgi:iron complex outermembrane receptor protein